MPACIALASGAGADWTLSRQFTIVETFVSFVELRVAPVLIGRK